MDKHDVIVIGAGAAGMMCAAVAGLRPEDLILGLDGTPIESVNDLQRLMTGELIGRAVTAAIVSRSAASAIFVRFMLGSSLLECPGDDRL